MSENGITSIWSNRSYSAFFTKKQVLLNSSSCTKFNADAWLDLIIQHETNCYTFAFGSPQAGWSLPGFLTAPFTVSSIGSRPIPPLAAQEIPEYISLKEGVLEKLKSSLKAFGQDYSEDEHGGQLHAETFRVYINNLLSSKDQVIESFLKDKFKTVSADHAYHAESNIIAVYAGEQKRKITSNFKRNSFHVIRKHNAKRWDEKPSFGPPRNVRLSNTEICLKSKTPCVGGMPLVAFFEIPETGIDFSQKLEIKRLAL
ncbi:MAG: hypothetical protein KDJ35_01340 [Alphaproteobacteria bacterium]|nr:hypothetical protein [Alphaproteobacteria bacterium]